MFHFVDCMQHFNYLIFRDVFGIGVLRQTDVSAVMAAHRLLSSVMHSNNDNDWIVHSLMLSLHNLRGVFLR